MRTKDQKYAVPTVELMIELLTTENPVTQCTLKNIIKGRAKRGDEDALRKYIGIAVVRMADMSRDQVKDIVMSFVQPYFDEVDVKKRELMTNFEDFENQYFWRPL